MKTTILSFLVLFLIGYSFAQNIDMDISPNGDTLFYEVLEEITSIPETETITNLAGYQNLTNEEKLKFREFVYDLGLFDVERQIKNLVDKFGISIYKMPDHELFTILDSFIKNQFQETPGYEYWLDELNEMKQGKNAVIEPLDPKDLIDRAWDDRLYYFNLKTAGDRFQMVECPEYSVLWKYTNSLYQHPTLKAEVEKEIYDLLYLIEGSDESYEARMLFLYNVFIDGDYELLSQHISRFLETDLQELIYTSADNKLARFTLVNDDLINSSGFMDSSRMNIHQAKVKEWIDNKLTVVLAMLKLKACTYPSWQYSYTSIINGLNSLVTIMESKSGYDEQIRKVKMYQIEFLNYVSTLHPYEIEFPRQMHNQLFEHIYYYHELTNAERINCFHFLFDVHSLFELQMEASDNNYYSFTRNSIFSHATIKAQELFQIETELNGADVSFRDKMRLLEKKTRYFGKNKDYQYLEMSIYQQLSEIKGSVFGYSSDQILQIIQTLIDFRTLQGKNCDELIKMLPFSYEPIVNHKLFATDPENFSLDQLELLHIEIIKALEEYENRSFDDSIPPVNLQPLFPEINVILQKLESKYLERKKYKKAYDIAQFRLNKLRFHDRLYSLLEQGKMENMQSTMQNIYSHQLEKVKEFSRHYDQETKKLTAYYNAKAKQLTEVRREKKKVQQELLFLNDSLESQRKTYVTLKEETIDLLNKKDSLIQYTDSLYEQSKGETLEEKLARIEAEKAKIESEAKSSRLTWISLGILMFLIMSLIFIYFLASQRNKLKLERNKAVLQKEISDCLRLVIDEVSHFGANLISAFHARHFETKESFVLLNHEQGSHELVEIRKLLRKCTSYSSKNVLTQTIEDEVEIGINMAYASYHQDYGRPMLTDICSIGEPIRDKEVPLYSVSNIIYDSFKHSLPGTVKRISIKQAYEAHNHIGVVIEGVSQKKISDKSSEIKTGTDFIRRVLKLFNENVVKAEFTRTITESGFITTFNLKKANHD